MSPAPRHSFPLRRALSLAPHTTGSCIVAWHDGPQAGYRKKGPDCEASTQGNQSGTQKQREPTAELVCMMPGLPPRNLPRTRVPDTQSSVRPFYFRSTYSILRAPVHSFQSGEQASFPGALGSRGDSM